MKVKVLGTSAAEGFPAVFCMCESCRKAQQAGGKNLRLRSSMLINDEVLVDLSPDFVCYKMKYGLDAGKIKTVLQTHTHQDHFNPSVLSYNHNSFSANPVKINIFLSSYAARLIRNTPLEKTEAIENITLNEVKPFCDYSCGKYTFTPLEAAHNAPQSLLYIISDGKKNMLYGNDTGMFTKNTNDFIKDKKFDIVSLDGTMGKDAGHANRHMGFDDIIGVKKHFSENNMADKDTIFIATHFSHFINMLHSEIEEYFRPHNILPAYDGMEIER